MKKINTYSVLDRATGQIVHALGTEDERGIVTPVGRPRPCRTDLRLSEAEKTRLQAAAERLGVTEAEAARLAIDRLCVQTLDEPKRTGRLSKRQSKVD